MWNPICNQDHHFLCLFFLFSSVHSLLSFSTSLSFSMFEVHDFPAVVEQRRPRNNPPLLRSHTYRMLRCDQCEHGPEVQHAEESREASGREAAGPSDWSNWELHQSRIAGTHRAALALQIFFNRHLKGQKFCGRVNSFLLVLVNSHRSYYSFVFPECEHAVSINICTNVSTKTFLV